jgi:hypothetical protein
MGVSHDVYDYDYDGMTEREYGPGCLKTSEGKRNGKNSIRIGKGIQRARYIMAGNAQNVFDTPI